MRCSDGSTFDPGNSYWSCPGQRGEQCLPGQPGPSSGRRTLGATYRLLHRELLLVGSRAQGCCGQRFLVLGPCPVAPTGWGVVHYRIQRAVEGVSVGSGESPGMGIRTWDSRLPLQLIHRVKRLHSCGPQPSHLNNGCIGLNYFLIVPCSWVTRPELPRSQIHLHGPSPYCQF